MVDTQQLRKRIAEDCRKGLDKQLTKGRMSQDEIESAILSIVRKAVNEELRGD